MDTVTHSYGYMTTKWDQLPVPASFTTPHNLRQPSELRFANTEVSQFEMSKNMDVLVAVSKSTLCSFLDIQLFAMLVWTVGIFQKLHCPILYTILYCEKYCNILLNVTRGLEPHNSSHIIVGVDCSRSRCHLMLHSTMGLRLMVERLLTGGQLMEGQCVKITMFEV